MQFRLTDRVTTGYHISRNLKTAAQREFESLLRGQKGKKKKNIKIVEPCQTFLPLPCTSPLSWITNMNAYAPQN